jgi:hypothetical protein
MDAAERTNKNKIPTVLILDFLNIWLLAANCENCCAADIHIFSKYST